MIPTAQHAEHEFGEHGDGSPVGDVENRGSHPDAAPGAREHGCPHGLVWQGTDAVGPARHGRWRILVCHSGARRDTTGLSTRVRPAG
jgi:hypothetical protein